MPITQALGDQPYAAESALEAMCGGGPGQASKAAAGAMRDALGPTTSAFAVNTLGRMHGMGGAKAWVSGPMEGGGGVVGVGAGGANVCCGGSGCSTVLCRLSSSRLHTLAVRLFCTKDALDPTTSALLSTHWGACTAWEGPSMGE